MAFDFRNPDYGPVFADRLKRLARIRSGELNLAQLRLHYRDQPADFINDWGVTIDPRNAEVERPVMVPFILFDRQREWCDWVMRHWRDRKPGLSEKSRDFGLSWLAVSLASTLCLFREDISIGFGSRKEEYVDKIGHPKSLFWKARQFVTHLPIEFNGGWDGRRDSAHLRLSFPYTGSTITGEAGDNIGRGDRQAIYFVDEAAYVERPQLIEASLSATTNCRIDISSANGLNNPFAEKRHGGKIDVFTCHWRDDPRKDQAWYDKQKATLDAVIVAQEIDINYSASIGDAFIPGELVADAQSRGPADIEAVGPIKIGVDVARFGGDKSAITIRRGRLVFPQKVFQGIDTMELVRKVQAEVDALEKAGTPVSQIAVDVIGVGAGVADRLRQIYPGNGDKESIVVDVNSSSAVDDGVNFNLRAQMWDNGREWLKKGPVSLPNDPELKSDLTSLKYRFKGDLRLIESKDDAKKRGIKSPDRADSLMLTFAYPCAEKKKRARVKIPVYRPTTPGLGM